MCVPPSGKAVTVTGIDMCRVNQGEIVESWAYADALGMLQQMDILPSLAPPPGNTAQ
jgi:predicted ester cyclase